MPPAPVVSWIEVVAAVIAIIAGLWGFTVWARKQFRDAVLDDIKPLLEEIGMSVNNVGFGEPKLIDRVKSTQLSAQKAETAAKLALSMGEANGMKVEELSGKVSVLSSDVQIALGSKGFEK